MYKKIRYSNHILLKYHIKIKIRSSFQKTYRFQKMGRLTRFERANAGATIRSVRPLHHNRHEMAGVVGFEPTQAVLETDVLPLTLYPFVLTITILTYL